MLKLLAYAIGISQIWSQLIIGLKYYTGDCVYNVTSPEKIGMWAQSIPNIVIFNSVV